MAMIGHWIEERGGCECSVCGAMRDEPTRYCPECGAQMTDREARIVTLSRIFDSLGFGWVEDHYVDDQGVVGLTLEECVWIYGLIIDTDGCRIDKDYTRSHYGKRLGLRVWDSKPTEAQMQEAEWHD